MSPPPTYSFLPWLRSGVANSIPQSDGDAAVEVRASIPLDVTLSVANLDGSTNTQVILRDVNLYAPGDIVGIDSKAVVKVEPRNWITNFEPNYLPYIEFYDEDFPWRYSPDVVDPAGRLRPWLALIVLTEDEFSDKGTLPGRPLPLIEIGSLAALPPPDQLGAWAHVH